MEQHSLNLELNDELAYLVGVIVGDGHISNAKKSSSRNTKDYRICIELTDLEYIQALEEIFKKYVKTESTIRETKKTRRQIKKLCISIQEQGILSFPDRRYGFAERIKD